MEQGTGQSQQLTDITVQNMTIPIACELEMPSIFEDQSDMPVQTTTIPASSELSMSPIFEEKSDLESPHVITVVQVVPNLMQDASSSSQLLKKKRSDTNTCATKSNPEQDDKPVPNKIDAPTAMQLARFEINWSSIPSEIVLQLECPVEDCGYFGVTETTYNRLVDQVVGQLRVISTRIPYNVFRQVASKITLKYKALMDIDDDGNPIGDGFGSLTEKLRNHNSYVDQSFKPGKRTSTKK